MAAANGEGKVVHLTEDSFDSDVLQGARPALVDFSATWCGPCKALAPVLEEVAAELEGEALVGKIDVDEAPALAQKYGVRGVPTVVLISGGEELARSVGLSSKEDLVDMVRQAQS